MKDISAVLSAEALANAILEKRAAEEKALTEQIDREAAAVERAKEAMEAATLAGDIKAYQKAKADRRDAEDAREMHESRLYMLTNGPLISQSEYEKAVANIYAEIAALDDQTKQQLAKLSDEMEQAADELQDATDYANKVLYQLQNNVYRNADRSKDKAGRILQLPHEAKAVNRWETIDWGKSGIRHYQYGQYTGRKVKG